MEAVMSIVVGTGNPGKLAEIRQILQHLPVEVLSVAEALGENVPNVTEDGETFEDNARLKANAIAKASMMVTLADDSGLEVDALGGRPGVRSRRFASEGATDAENNAELLKRLEEVHEPQRTARFRATIVVIDPHTQSQMIATGCCEGTIARKPSGTGGFGYDPLFIVDENGRTMADLTETEKNEISHRGRALRDLQPQLEGLLKARLLHAEQVLDRSIPPPGPESTGTL